MKLAEALVLRADLKKRVEQLRARLLLCTMVQEGEQPPENPHELLAELDRLVAQLTDLVVRINRTNLQGQIVDGTRLTDALAQRDGLTLRASVLSTAAESASNRLDRYSRAEIKKVPTIDVGAIRRQIDTLAQQRRELDTAIQAANWAIDLIP